MNRSKALAINITLQRARIGRDSIQSLNIQEALAKIAYFEGNLTEAAEIRHRTLQHAISRDGKPLKKAKAYHNVTYGITLTAQEKIGEHKS